MVVSDRIEEHLSSEARRRTRERGRRDGACILLHEGRDGLVRALARVEAWAGAAQIRCDEAERRAAYAGGLRDALADEAVA